MSKSPQLSDFVRDALSAGRSRDEIKAALTDADWSPHEVETAMAHWSETPFVPPVPRPVPQLNARDAFVYAALFAALGFTASYLIALIHNLLELWIADTSERYVSYGAARGVRWAIAVLIVAGPIYLWLTIRTSRQAASDPGQRRSLVRKWLTYLALFIAALVFFGDAVYVIYSFLDGELTLLFGLKALTVAVVSGAVLAFYLRDVEEMKDAE